MWFFNTKKKKNIKVLSRPRQMENSGSGTTVDVDWKNTMIKVPSDFLAHGFSGLKQQEPVFCDNFRCCCDAVEWCFPNLKS
jgi:hypothetical protein